MIICQHYFRDFWSLNNLQKLLTVRAYSLVYTCWWILGITGQQFLPSCPPPPSPPFLFCWYICLFLDVCHGLQHHCTKLRTNLWPTRSLWWTLASCSSMSNDWLEWVRRFLKRLYICRSNKWRGSRLSLFLHVLFMYLSKDISGNSRKWNNKMVLLLVPLRKFHSDELKKIIPSALYEI